MREGMIKLLSLLFIPIFVFYPSKEAAVSSKIDFEKPEKKEEISRFLASFLPPEIEGWKPAEKDILYDPETIFSYIDGAGEVYRAYNFRWLLVRRYERKNYPEIIVDFFDMGQSEDAFGIFTHDLEGERVDVGQDGLYKGGWLAFWKDQFYVSIYSEQETEEIKKGIIALGAKIAQAIPKEGKRPLILNYMPLGWDKNQAHYFHLLPILNYHFFVTTENWLELDATTQALLTWKLKENKKKMYLLIINYGDEAKAQRAINRFLENYLPEADETGTARTEDGFWDGAKAHKTLGIVVFGAESAQEVETIIDQVIINSDKIGK